MYPFCSILGSVVSILLFWIQKKNFNSRMIINRLTKTESHFFLHRSCGLLSLAKVIDRCTVSVFQKINREEEWIYKNCYFMFSLIRLPAHFMSFNSNEKREKKLKDKSTRQNMRGDSKRIVYTKFITFITHVFSKL